MLPRMAMLRPFSIRWDSGFLAYACRLQDPEAKDAWSGCFYVQYRFTRTSRTHPEKNIAPNLMVILRSNSSSFREKS